MNLNTNTKYIFTYKKMYKTIRKKHKIPGVWYLKKGGKKEKKIVHI